MRDWFFRICKVLKIEHDIPENYKIIFRQRISLPKKFIDFQQDLIHDLLRYSKLFNLNTSFSAEGYIEPDILGFVGEVYLYSSDRSSMHLYASLYKFKTFLVTDEYNSDFDPLLDRNYTELLSSS